MRYSIIIICIFFSIHVSAQGIIDGFIDAPKSKALAFSGSYETADIYFLWNSDLELPITSFTASLFFKHQITKKLGYAASIPLINGVPQDGSVFLKYGQSFKLSNSFSLSGIGAIGGSHPLSNYETESASSIGQQAKSIGLRAVAQLTFKNRFFISPRYGINYVSDPTPNNSIASVKIGFYKNKWYVDFWAEQITADGGKDYRGVGDAKAESFTELGFDSERLGGVIYHQTTEKTGLFIGGSYTLRGRNAYKIKRISAGAVWKF